MAPTKRGPTKRATKTSKKTRISESEDTSNERPDYKPGEEWVIHAKREKKAVLWPARIAGNQSDAGTDEVTIQWYLRLKSWTNRYWLTSALFTVPVGALRKRIFSMERSKSVSLYFISETSERKIFESHLDKELPVLTKVSPVSPPEQSIRHIGEFKQDPYRGNPNKLRPGEDISVKGFHNGRESIWYARVGIQKNTVRETLLVHWYEELQDYQDNYILLDEVNEIRPATIEETVEMVFKDTLGLWGPPGSESESPETNE